MSQTSYAEQKSAFPGMKANLGKAENVLSYVAEGRLLFGLFVCLGTNLEEQVKVPAVATDITNELKGRGVVLHSHATESVKDGLEPGQLDKGMVSVMGKGFVYVKVTETVVPTDAVAVRFGGAGDKGSFGKTVTAGETAVLPKARYVKGAAAGEIAILELY